MKAETLARWERFFRPILTRLPAGFVIPKYSAGRNDFLGRLKNEEVPDVDFEPSGDLGRELWGLRFRTPIMNAAGMFKNGECHDLTFAQGAGGYLGGTGTWNGRNGNDKDGVKLPFVPYPKSGAASNFLGLPNDGDEINSDRAAALVERKGEGFPTGWSIMGSPDFDGNAKQERLVDGMRLYDEAGVDFIEMNVSCPNTSGGVPQYDGLPGKLRYVKENFLDQRGRRLPVVVKFSNDTNVTQVPELMDTLFELGFDGVNFGNTSTNYGSRKLQIHPGDLRLYDRFTGQFGGGVSGRPLRHSSLELAGRAVEYRNKGAPSQEFHVIRTGGVETLNDVKESDRAGISLNQWFTGYFEGFAKHGHRVYKEFFSGS